MSEPTKPKSTKTKRWRIPRQDADLVQLISNLALVALPDVESARLESERVSKGDTIIPTTQILVDVGKLTMDQARRLSSGLGKVIATCYRCLKRSSYEREGFTGKFICQRCQEAVSFEDDTAGLGEALLPEPPTRIVDKLVEKILTKRGQLASDELVELRNMRKSRIPRPTMLDLLKERGQLGSKRLLELKGKAEAMYRKRMVFWKALQKDYELACFLCSLRIVSQRDLSNALIKQLESAMNNNFLPLRQELARTGLLTQHQVDKFLPAQFDNETYRRTLLLTYCGHGQRDRADDDLEESDWEDSMAEMIQELHNESNALNVLSLDDAGSDDARSVAAGQAFKEFAEQELKGIDSADDLKGMQVRRKGKGIYRGGKREG